MSEKWVGIGLNTPPVAGAEATAKGWEIPLKGTDPADGLMEVVVAWGGLATLAGGSNIQSVEVPDAGWYMQGEHLDFYVTWNEDVVVTGSPRIAITLTSGTVYATYAAGSGTNRLRFRYTVGASDVDKNGILLTSPMELNSGTLKDEVDSSVNAGLTFTLPTTSGILVDAVEPTIDEITALAAHNYVDDEDIEIEVVFDEEVDVELGDEEELERPTITIYQNDGTTPIGDAVYESGAGTDTLTFVYTVQDGDESATAIKVGADITDEDETITDLAGNLAVLTVAQVTMTDVTINDVTAATISGVAVTEDGTGLDAGATMHVVVTFSEKVNVVTTGGVPRIPVFANDGTTPLENTYATYASGTGTTALTFNYVVDAADDEATGVQVGADVSLNGGTIKDLAGNNAVLTFAQEETTVTLNVAPTILTVAATEQGTDVDTPGPVNIVVTFDEAVVVVTTGGTPRIPVFANDGTTPLTNTYATYASGTGTDELTFQYVVDAADDEATGIKVGADISLNGGTLKDAGGNNADLTFTQHATTVTLNQS